MKPRTLRTIETPITNEAEAVAYIKALNDAGLLYHFDDDLDDIHWGCGTVPSVELLHEMKCRAEELDEIEYPEHGDNFAIAIKVSDGDL